ncbi:Polynucleotidyl transferase, ribonuclease H-like superfamily protein [Prunus dulcis]|uniref:Polynucleotidyl transferase, ribonuclease H-like superfamily protein n=1 Tax=Prunus dulcis TaxID=3755 RepID=A0A4Y1QSZ6_PRUDU|nr:Polynucleotidyl transferase, ribonuclease H-like superfamily protein [Prunus dulcis]
MGGVDSDCGGRWPIKYDSLKSGIQTLDIGLERLLRIETRVRILRLNLIPHQYLTKGKLLILNKAREDETWSFCAFGEQNGGVSWPSSVPWQHHFLLSAATSQSLRTHPSKGLKPRSSPVPSLSVSLGPLTYKFYPQKTKSLFSSLRSVNLRPEFHKSKISVESQSRCRFGAHSVRSSSGSEIWLKR